MNGITARALRYVAITALAITAAVTGAGIAQASAGMSVERDIYTNYDTGFMITLQPDLVGGTCVYGYVPSRGASNGFITGRTIIGARTSFWFNPDDIVRTDCYVLGQGY
ncbi:hypothetical protein AB0N05_34870 [Nocardia sp. NPDC051030]|uniref:hypothetical protein n=1 Tax=Nocardia sp. NPDC051030 TaxID=3155162 RepID=UPI0034336CD0